MSALDPGSGGPQTAVWAPAAALFELFMQSWASRSAGQELLLQYLVQLSTCTI